MTAAYTMEEHTMFKILVPVNASTCALKAVDEAIRTAKERGGASIHLLNVQPLFHRHISRFAAAGQTEAMRVDRARTAVDEAMRRVRAAGMPCTAHMVRGRIQQGIVRFAAAQRIDQIVVATSPLRGMGRWLKQPLADRLVKAAEVPVDVVVGRPVGMLERFGLPAGLSLGLAMVWLVNE